MNPDQETKTENHGPNRDLDYEETHQQQLEADRSRTYRVFSWLTENTITVVALLVLATFVAAGVMEYEIPRFVRTIGLSASIALVLIGRPVARRARDMLWDPTYIWLVDLDATSRVSALYRIPSQSMPEFDVVDGELDWATPELVFGKDVDLEAQTIVGTWRGTFTDRELLTAVSAITACRDQLEDDAKIGYMWDNNAFIIVRKATMDAVATIRDTFERGTLPDEGEGITRAVDKALEGFGVTRGVDDLEDDDPTDDRAELTIEELVDNSIGAPQGATSDD